MEIHFAKYVKIGSPEGKNVLGNTTIYQMHSISKYTK